MYHGMNRNRNKMQRENHRNTSAPITRPCKQSCLLSNHHVRSHTKDRQVDARAVPGQGGYEIPQWSISP
jgi:hypothetical protein